MKTLYFVERDENGMLQWYWNFNGYDPEVTGFQCGTLEELIAKDHLPFKYVKHLWSSGLIQKLQAPYTVAKGDTLCYDEMGNQLIVKNRTDEPISIKLSVQKETMVT